MINWDTIWQNLKSFFVESEAESYIGNNYVAYILQFLFFAVLLYYVFRILKTNKAGKFIPVVILVILFSGVTFAFSQFKSQTLVLVIILVGVLVFAMFNTEIKRTLLDANMHHSKTESMSVKGIEQIMEEVVRAVQSMSKKDIGALIVLSDENLPEGIIESGTVVNASITSEMIEAIFYPKAPLHDGAMIIEGDRIYAAGCFLPIAQSENLPKDMGSRHRAALGVTAVASVTAIVVSEETGIISIVKNGAVKKKYADAGDIKNALSDFYWSDLTAEGK